jgi:anion-transporting  ArsA/GET3 family ATPase
MEKNNLQYFTFSQNSEKLIKAVFHHLPPDTPAEDILNSLENLDFNIINVRQLMTNRRTSNGQIYMETLPFILRYLNKKRKISRDFQAE